MQVYDISGNAVQSRRWWKCSASRKSARLSSASWYTRFDASAFDTLKSTVQSVGRSVSFELGAFASSANEKQSVRSGANGTSTRSFAASSPTARTQWKRSAAKRMFGSSCAVPNATCTSGYTS